MTGPPAKAVLKAEGKAAQCKTTPNFAWIPNSATPRFAELTFNLAAGTLAPRVDELVLWVMNKGKLDPPIWSIDLLLRPRGAAASSTPLRVPVFLGEDGMLGDLECPGENSIRLAYIPGQGMRAAVFRTSTVVGVRINVNNGTIARPVDVIQLASVGLSPS